MMSEAFHPEGELTACPECGAAPVEHLDFGTGGKKAVQGKRTYFISGCRGCGLIFVNPPPAPAEVAALYVEGGHWTKMREVDPAAPPKSVTPALHAEKIAAFAERLGLPSQPSVFDFGCGGGEILNELKARGWTTAGLDPATTTTITAHDMLTEIPAAPSFDVIVAKHVLEHTTNPIATMRNLRRALKPGGFIFFGQPCLDDVQSHGKKTYCINSVHHFTGYTKRSFTHMLRFVGFEPVELFHLDRSNRFCAVAQLAPPAAVQDADPLADARRDLAAARGDDTTPAPILAARFLDERKRLKAEKRKPV